ncbi:MAG: urease accessory protein UreD [Litoreibacter sp.]
MLDANSSIAHQRTKGCAKISLGARGIGMLHQSGAGKIMLPQVDGPREVVFLNTSGGITGGDVLEYELSLRDGHATATTQTAERAYRSVTGAGQIETVLRVADGGHLNWLPQETILFEDAHLQRDLAIELEGRASVLFVDTLVLGRAAMGETIQSLKLRDRREVRRDGRLIYREAISLTPDMLTRRGQSALCGDARAMASLVLITPDPERYLNALNALEVNSVRMAASAWDEKLVMRFLAPDAFPLRRAMISALETLNLCPIPRVWQI